MRINDFIWLPDVVDKLRWKHGVAPSEVEEVFAGSFKVKKAEKGIRKNEDVYYAYGQTDSGRYLTVIFVYKMNKNALILSAR
ncbi:BrnT family toxin, partial [Candidatus Poribacteria bacterium]|nr:BrnT family toxin [Candidatus Poribacteria bacterium]